MDNATKSTVKKSKSNKALAVVLVIVLFICLCFAISSLVAYYVYSTINTANLNSLSTTQQFQDEVNPNNDTEVNNWDNETPQKLDEDIPVYPGSKLVGTITRVGNELSATFSIDAPVSDLVTFYDDELFAAGWDVGSSGDFGTYIFLGTKADRDLSIGLIGDEEGVNSTITITVSSY